MGARGEPARAIFRDERHTRRAHGTAGRMANAVLSRSVNAALRVVPPIGHGLVGSECGKNVPRRPAGRRVVSGPPILRRRTDAPVYPFLPTIVERRQEHASVRGSRRKGAGARSGRQRSVRTLRVARGEQGPDEEDDQRAHHGADQSRTLAGLVPADRLAEVGRDECAGDAEEDGQDEPCGLVRARMDQPAITPAMNPMMMVQMMPMASAARIGSASATMNFFPLGSGAARAIKIPA